MGQLSPIGWALRPLQRYADFSGRAPRREYWWFVLFEWIAFMVLLVSAMMISASTDSQGGQPLFWIFLIPALLGFLLLAIPNIAVQVRRLHDQNLTGWLVLLFFIPYIGGLVGLVFMCLRGTAGPNRFGADPYESEDGYLADVFA